VFSSRTECSYSDRKQLCNQNYPDSKELAKNENISKHPLPLSADLNQPASLQAARNPQPATSSHVDHTYYNDNSTCDCAVIVLLLLID
jgi:hypothetical protein